MKKKSIHIGKKGIFFFFHENRTSLNKHLPKEDTRIATKHMKGCSRNFPGGPALKTPCIQCKGRAFDPWSAN